MKQMKLTKYSTLCFQSNNEFSHWVGYYTICPISADGKKMLVHRSRFDGRDISQNDSIEVGWIDLFSEKYDFHRVDSTVAFNWQQGANLQWVGDDCLIYNIVSNDKYASRIYHIDTGDYKDIDSPIYIADGPNLFSLDYERLYWCRAYHYCQIIVNEKNKKIVEKDGIYKTDLKKNKKELLVTIDSIIKIDPDDDFGELKHWLEHLVFNADKTKIAFFHRYELKDGTYKTRIFTMNTDGTELSIIPGWRDGYYTHLNWWNNNLIVCFTVRSGKLKSKIISQNKKESQNDRDQNNSKGRRDIKRIIINVYRKFFVKFIPDRIRNKYFNHKRYVVYDIKKGFINEFDNYNLYVDGHPSFTKDGQYMLTDTYADKHGFRNLMIYDIKKNKIYKIGSFYSPFNACPYRSDLHPRFSRDEKYVVVDSAHSGRHQVVVIKINWDKIRK